MRNNVTYKMSLNLYILFISNLEWPAYDMYRTKYYITETHKSFPKHFGLGGGVEVLMFILTYFNCT